MNKTSVNEELILMRPEIDYSAIIAAVKQIPGSAADAAIESLGGSAELYMKMLSQLARSSVSNCGCMSDSLQTGDMSQFGIKAHGLKGSLGQAGFIKLSKSAEALENAAKSGDLPFCLEHYAEFKNELLRFAEELNTILGNTSAENDRGINASADITDYTDILDKVKNALWDYDSLTASEHLAPLLKMRFRDEEDVLLARTAEALETYRPQLALEFLTQLLDLMSRSKPISGGINKVSKILVADDNTATLTMINGILSSLYKVYPVDSGATALRFLEKQHPDLILIDFEMPEMNGIELFNAIKTMPAFSDIPIIFLTGNTDIESEATAFKLGASDYIRKPVNNVVLLSRVKMQLELAAYRNGTPYFSKPM